MKGQLASIRLAKLASRSSGSGINAPRLAFDCNGCRFTEASIGRFTSYLHAVKPRFPAVAIEAAGTASRSGEASAETSVCNIRTMKPLQGFVEVS